MPSPAPTNIDLAADEDRTSTRLQIPMTEPLEQDFAAIDNAGNARQLTASERREAIVGLHKRYCRGRGIGWTGGWSYERLSQTFRLSVGRCKNIVSEAREKEECRNGTQQAPASNVASAPTTSPNAGAVGSPDDSALATTTKDPSAVSIDASSEQQTARPTIAPAPADATNVEQPPEAEKLMSLRESLYALSELTRAADEKALDTTDLPIANLTQQQQQRLTHPSHPHLLNS